MNNNNPYPYAEEGARDEVKSVGISDSSSVHPDAKRTTYVRDYDGKEPTLKGYGTMFRTGMLTTAEINNDFGNTKTSIQDPPTNARNPTYDETNATYMGLGKTQAFDDDRKNPIRKGNGPVQGKTTMKRSYKDRGFGQNPQIDGNQFYTNNFGKKPRPDEVDNHVDQTQVMRTYKGHWLPEGESAPFEEMPPKPRSKMNKKTEYKKKYKKPGYRNMSFQTTNSRGLNYGNRFARKPQVHQSETMYSNDYKIHQQRVMNALNGMKR